MEPQPLIPERVRKAVLAAVESGDFEAHMGALAGGDQTLALDYLQRLIAYNMATSRDDEHKWWVFPADSKPDVVLADGEHHYWSTHCRHDRHKACLATELAPGVPRRPAQCKTCAAPCLCPCHAAGEGAARDPLR